MSRARTLMFTLGRGRRVFTWNPVVGCRFECVYCWARRYARRLAVRCPRCARFTPHLHPERLYGRLPKRPRRPRITFVCDMADLFGPFIPRAWIERVLEACRRYVAWSKGRHVFFYETKNPGRYGEFLDLMPRNSILSTTIETDAYPQGRYITKAPSPLSRWLAFKDLPWPNKHVSVEPVMAFTPRLLKWLSEIDGLKVVSVGMDNYGVLGRLGLPEPSAREFYWLVDELETVGIVVEIKTRPEDRGDWP